MKKIIIFIVCRIFCIFILFLTFKNKNEVKNTNLSNEYIPEEEISTSQNRTTIITLYFLNPKNSEIIPEARGIDVKEIMNNPYEKILEMLMEGSVDNQIGKTIPEGTKVNSVKLEGSELIIDFDNGFVLNDKNNSEIQDKIVESIEVTFLQLKEISSVTILVNGEKVFQ